MQLKLPIRPTKIEYDLVVQDKFTDLGVGRLEITVHTDREGKFLTVDVDLYDDDNWCIETKTVTMPTEVRLAQ
jgi:hypothetical protein